ncbi:MAG: class I SAM-dependent methyltransferase [Armatimonadota bacterium]|jgi:ubiquinone/menaquinone biosynthesis C-methylase UbiE
MRASELRQMYEFEDDYWWFVGRRRLVRRLIERHAPERETLRVLDAGCGTGGTLAKLEGIGELWGCDLATEALAMCRERGFANLKQARVEEMDFPDEHFDVVISCDVLEHVEADDAVMAEMTRLLSPGGICVMTVPAHRWLWSAHDEALDHLRRYESGAFRELIEGAGLKIELFSKAVAIAMPAILASVAYRRIVTAIRGDDNGPKQTALFRLPGPLNTALIWMLDLEIWLIRHLSLPIGASLVAVARKPARG